METQIRSVSQIYDVYAAFSSAVTTASATLWAELDINKLVSLTDEFALRMKRMKALKSQITYINLEAKLKGFQDSLPLIQVIMSTTEFRSLVHCINLFSWGGIRLLYHLREGRKHVLKC